MMTSAENFRPNLRQLGPSIATWAHQISGVAAAALITQGVEWVAISAWLVVLAWLFDLADGFWARAVLKNDPPEDQQALANYGDRLDAIVDGWNFGWLPAWIAGWAAYHSGVAFTALVTTVVAGAFYAMSVQYRLSRAHFLKKVSGTVWFWGSPCPCPSMLLVAFVALAARNFLTDHVWPTVTVQAVLFLLLGRICWSTIRYSHNKVWWTKIPGELLVLSILGIGVGAVVWLATFQVVDALLGVQLGFWSAYMLQPLFYGWLGVYERIQ